jgi:hypothetical protein
VAKGCKKTTLKNYALQSAERRSFRGARSGAPQLSRCYLTLSFSSDIYFSVLSADRSPRLARASGTPVCTGQPFSHAASVRPLVVAGSRSLANTLYATARPGERVIRGDRLGKPPSDGGRRSETKTFFKAAAAIPFGLCKRNPCGEMRPLRAFRLPFRTSQILARVRGVREARLS